MVSLAPWPAARETLSFPGPVFQLAHLAGPGRGCCFSTDPLAGLQCALKPLGQGEILIHDIQEGPASAGVDEDFFQALPGVASVLWGCSFLFPSWANPEGTVV